MPDRSVKSTTNNIRADAGKAALFPELPKERFAILYADPPWDYKGQRQHNGAGGQDTGGAMRHYPTVTLERLKELAVSSIAADNSLLFLWSSSPHLDQAMELGKAWGFAWATVAFVWNKMKTNPGFYTLSQCELCLAFKRGKIPTPRGARNIRQYLERPRQRHSQKPDEVRQRIEAMFPNQRKIELFARQQSEGWSAWGQEAQPSILHSRPTTPRESAPQSSTLSGKPLATRTNR